MRAPIRVRITAWYVALLACVLILVAAFVVVRLRADLVSATDHFLRPALNQIATGYAREGLPEFHDQSATVLAEERAASQVLSRDHAIVRSFGDPVSSQPMLDPSRAARVLAQSGVSVFTTSLGRAGPFRVAARRVLRSGQTQVVVAAASLAPVDRSVRRVLILLLLALPAAALITAAGGWWLARRALRPIDRMIGTAEAIGPADMRLRVVVPPTRDEVAHLARTLNTMLDRIQRGVHEQQRLVADTSHELRTPLAAMRTELDVSLRTDHLGSAAREILESTREEVDRMSATVEDLLTLARSDGRGPGTTHAPIDLAELVAQAARHLDGLATRRGVKLVTKGPGAPAHGDPDALEHVARNLIDNAIKFSPPGGLVTARTFIAESEVGLVVEDDGPGIPEDLRERIFDRFFRVDSSRARGTGGSGLGLAIVREIVDAHGGRVSVTHHTPHGSAFTVTLPANPYARPQ